MYEITVINDSLTVCKKKKKGHSLGSLNQTIVIEAFNCPHYGKFNLILCFLAFFHSFFPQVSILQKVSVGFMLSRIYGDQAWLCTQLKPMLPLGGAALRCQCQFEPGYSFPPFQRLGS